MCNFIDYFYGIKIDNIEFDNKNYFFIYKGYLYKLYAIDNGIDINLVVNINKAMVGRTLISKVIVNQLGNYISNYNGISYILMRIYADNNKQISINDIDYLGNSLYTNKINSNWGVLWSKKIDYLENLISQFGKKYPIMVNSFNYFVGMAENAISYFNSIKFTENYSYYISHKVMNIDKVVDCFYNPLNIIFDYKVRDIAEYIKKVFFCIDYDKSKIYNEINKYFSNNKFTKTDIKLLIARLLYPSFYFELYEKILVEGQNEKIILDVVSNLDDYEKYLNGIINYFKKQYGVDDIKWLGR